MSVTIPDFESLSTDELEEELSGAVCIAAVTQLPEYSELAKIIREEIERRATKEQA